MKSLPEISILLFAVLLFLGTTEESDAVYVYGTSNNEQLENKSHSSSITLENRFDFYCSLPRGNAAVSLQRVPPVPFVKNGPEEESRTSLTCADSPRNRISNTLFLLRNSDHKLTARELLFPYHSFL